MLDPVPLAELTPMMTRATMNPMTKTNVMVRSGVKTDGSFIVDCIGLLSGIDCLDAKLFSDETLPSILIGLPF